MGARVRLASDSVQVTPGASSTLEVTVRNTGTVVDQFTIDVLGDAAAWAAADPPVLSLFPATEETTTIRFAPPRSATIAAGPVAFGIRASSHEDPSGSAVEEGTVTVDAFQDTVAELLPRTSRGSRSATHEVAVDNRGNERLNASLEPSDPDQLLAFDVRPPGMVIEPGTSQFAKVRVSPRQRFWRGTPKTRSFSLAVTSPGGAPIKLDGSMLQEAILPRWLIPALLALLALVILAIVLWLTVLQPSIKSAATQALADAGITPAPSAGAGGGAGAGSGGAGSPSPAPSSEVLTPPPSSAPGVTPAPGGGGGLNLGGTPVDGRLSVDGTNPNGVSPSKTTLYITDLVFANPSGASGPMQLKRGTLVLMSLRLENFRDLDFHFVTPIVVKSGEQLTLTATCSSSPCDPSVYYSGFTSP
jgi:hypothetical protein